MHRNKSVDSHKFSMVPKAEIPRSAFKRQFTHKTTFNAGYLIPIYCDEVLPGDHFNMKATFFARMSTPLFPLMDNLYLDSFFFFVPIRLIWSNFKKFMGEQANPTDSVSYQVPQCVSPVGGYPVGGLHDFFGLPTVGQIDPGATFSHNNLPLRAYYKIYNEWFRDQNLVSSAREDTGDGPDLEGYYDLRKRGKRHDYFTSALPWTQKNASVLLPLGENAPVKGLATVPGTVWSNSAATTFRETGGTDVNYPTAVATNIASSLNVLEDPLHSGYPGIYADLAQATSATINQLRQAFQIQRLLERDARGGTRYTEIVRAHFGVTSPDARLQRPEYLGGGSTPVNINPVTQTSATDMAGSTTPLGELAAYATIAAHGHGFSASFTEHGYIIGLINIRADLTYQQGLHKMWSRQTKYDFYFPAFANLGEQAILNKEIYCKGLATDDDVFGYQERWAEYRYKPSMITGLFRSAATGTLDSWHLAQNFTTLPSLNMTFIEENPPMDRILAVGGAANGQHFIMDSFFDCKAARPMPLYSVPGLIDHF